MRRLPEVWGFIGRFGSPGGEEREQLAGNPQASKYWQELAFV